MLEDGSLGGIAANLIQCARWIRNDDEPNLTKFLNTLPPDDRVSAALGQSARKKEDGGDAESSDSDDSEEGDEQMEEVNFCKEGVFVLIPFSSQNFTISLIFFILPFFNFPVAYACNVLVTKNR